MQQLEETAIPHRSGVGHAAPAAPAHHAGRGTPHRPTLARGRIICVALGLVALACSNRTGERDAGTTTSAARAVPAASQRIVGDSTAVTAASADVTPANAGFAGPENLVYDSVADVYLVSNINGDATARDANGFVSRLDSAGHVIAQKWIDGANANSRLDAPKGLAIHGDTLVIADVGVVRLFNRRTGASLGVWQTPGVILNDVAFAPDGTLYVTDTRGSNGVGTIYHFDRTGHARGVASGAALDGPDGIVALPDGGVLYATFGADRVARLGADGQVTPVATLPGEKVDGLRRLADGSYVVTSWDAHAVYRLRADGTLQPLLTGVKSPAGVAIEARRHRIAITSMLDDRLYFATLH